MSSVPVGKLHLTREHARELLHGMILVRRFEEKCAELYTQEKIRGFLHLYIGEEANAVGVMQALTPDEALVATYREHGHALVARLARRRGDGGDVRQGQRVEPWARRLDAHLRCEPPILWRQRDRRRRLAGGRGPGPGRQDARHESRHLLLLWRGRGGRGRIPRVAQPGGAVEAARAVRLREQPVLDGHRRRSARWRCRISTCTPGATAFPRRWWTAWTWSRSRRRPACGGRDSRRRRSATAGEQDLSLLRALDVRRRVVSRQGRGGALEIAVSDPQVLRPGCCRTPSCTSRISPQSNPTSPRSWRRPSPSPRRRPGSQSNS